MPMEIVRRAPPVAGLTPLAELPACAARRPVPIGARQPPLFALEEAGASPLAGIAALLPLCQP